MTEVNVKWTQSEDISFDCKGEDSGAQVTIGKGGSLATEAFLMGLVSCSSFTLVSILKKMRLELEDLEVHAEGNIRDDDPRYYTDIHLEYEVKGDIPEDKLEKALELAEEKCPIIQTVGSDTEITYNYQLK